MVKITISKEFSSRAHLDDYVRSRFGENTEANAEHVIEAPTAELVALGLSEDSTVYGVRIIAKDQNDDVK